MKTKVVKNWDELSAEQKEMAVNSYAAVREAEEGMPCSRERATEMAPLCKGYVINEYRNGETALEVDI